MISGRLLTTGLLCFGLAMLGLIHFNVTAQEPPISKTYILTQATCPPTMPPASPTPVAHVPQGATVQIQLPGNREPNGKWEFVGPFPMNMKLISTKVIDNQGRIPGLDAIYIFNFTAISAGRAIITMRATPPFSVSYPNLKNPDQVMCPLPQGGPNQQTYSLATLNFYLIVD